MNPYMAYEAMNTKIMTKNNGVFDKKKFEKLLKCDSVDQVVDILLNEYHFNQIIEETISQDLHRDDLEILFRRYEVLEIENILHYFSGPYREFLRVFLMEFEIYDLIMILRQIAKGKDSVGMDIHFIHSERNSKLPYEKLIGSKSFVQFIEHLKNSPYYVPLKTVNDRDIIKRQFHTEMKLQMLFYKTLMIKSNTLSTRDKPVVQELIGTKIDGLNVQWIYRAKKNYNISPEEMLIYSIQGGKRLGYGRLKELCYAKSLEEIKGLSNQYLKVDLFATDYEPAVVMNFDKYMNACLNDRKYSGTIGVVVSYIFKLDMIVKDLFAVTEGIRYQVPKEHLKQYLISVKIRDQRPEVK
ncbi:MAG TPA: hypothetical protein DDZ89_14020 [Clostridiales bacterium]|nr:hypothetical protein [Clostridiales bacterium]